jgi:hypothetical protein
VSGQDSDPASKLTSSVRTYTHRVRLHTPLFCCRALRWSYSASTSEIGVSCVARSVPPPPVRLLCRSALFIGCFLRAPEARQCLTLAVAVRAAIAHASARAARRRTSERHVAASDCASYNAAPPLTRRRWRPARRPEGRENPLPMRVRANCCSPSLCLSCYSVQK